MIPLTVYVREDRVEEFYIRLAEFIVDAPGLDAPGLDGPLVLPSGRVPAWIQAPEAAQIASRFMHEISGMGYAVLRYLINEARTETARFSAEEYAAITKHPKGKSGVAGVLGGVGRAVRRAGLPMYRTPKGDTWHYVWDWDGEAYSMTPEVAELLRAVRL